LSRKIVGVLRLIGYEHSTKGNHMMESTPEHVKATDTQPAAGSTWPVELAGTASTRRSANLPTAASPNQVLAIASVGMILANLDLFVVNVALPNIALDFGNPSLESLSWILNGYTITYAALLVFFGRLSERYPRNVSFLVGIGSFTAASAACAAATSTEMLVAFRVVQATAAALVGDGPQVVRHRRKRSRRHHQKDDKKSHGETPLARHYIVMEFLDARKIERPNSSLLKYYAIISALTGPGFLVEFPRLFFKYETLKYRFEDDGMSMSWGVLFRHEINLTYRRIQDIHLSRNRLLNETLLRL